MRVITQSIHDRLEFELMFLSPVKKVLLQRLFDCIICKNGIDRTKSDGKEFFLAQVEGLSSKLVFVGGFREKDTLVVSLYKHLMQEAMISVFYIQDTTSRSLTHKIKG